MKKKPVYKVKMKEMSILEKENFKYKITCELAEFLKQVILHKKF